MKIKATRHLPHELIDYIIHFLQQDILSLRFCSLVSYCWTNPARRHLFRRVRYHVNGNELDSARFEELLGFLQSSPTICSYIQALTIRGGTDHGAATELDGALVPKLFAVLPSLKELNLITLIFTPYDSDHNFEVPPIGEMTLEELSIRDIDIIGELQLSSLV